MPLKLPHYSTEGFQDRDNELADVKRTLDRISAGEKLPSRTLVFRGASGLGKSWLSIHLKRTVLTNENTLALFIGLGARYDQILNDRQPETEWLLPPSAHSETVRDLARWIAAKVGSTRATDATAHQITSWLVQSLERPTFGTSGPGYRLLALILDSVFEADWALLEALETALLAPLAALPNVIIIITGRGRAYPWKSPYLSMPVVSRDLRSFIEATKAEDPYQYLRAQLASQMPGVTFEKERLHKIATIGEGYPKNNLLVAQFEEQEAKGEQLDPSIIIEEVLSFIEDVTERREIRGYLEALCVLDEGFREDQIGPLYGTRFNKFKTSMSLPESRKIRDKLVEQHVVRWEAGRYVIDRSLRSIILYVLQEQDRRNNTRVIPKLHECAATLYKEWDTQYNSPYYGDLAKKHLAQIPSDTLV